MGWVNITNQVGLKANLNLLILSAGDLEKQRPGFDRLKWKLVIQRVPI